MRTRAQVLPASNVFTTGRSLLGHGAISTYLPTYLSPRGMVVTVGIIGSGTAGLVSAHVLKQDGFNVTILSKDKTPGGVWARERIYPGLALNK